MIRKAFRSSAFIAFFALAMISGNAQEVRGKIDLNDERFKKLQERSRERSKGIMPQPSAYDEKNRNVLLNPEMPNCRDVSQYQIVDKSNIRILYAFNATDLTNPATYDDLQRLEIGKTHVKYYSEYAYQGDSCATSDMIETNEIFHSNYKLEGGNVCVAMEMRGKHQGWSQYLFSEYFKDLTTNEMTEYCRMPAYLDNYNSYYIESIPTQEWEIENETLEIAGYNCQKARCYFRGRNYTAWFTLDIPMDHGPWKFGGLPGLILKVYDDNQKFIFECVGIEQPQEPYSIILLNNYCSYRRTTRTKLNKLLKRICEDYYELSGLTNTASKLLYPFNPMELK